VVTRSTDAATAGAQYKLWTTLKVPQGFSMEAHAHYLAEKIGAKHFRLMPAKGIFALGVGHVRRREMTPGLRAEAPAEMHEVKVQSLSAPEWRVLTSLKRDFAPAEIRENLWVPRAEEAEVSLAEFFTVAQELNQRRVIGRFSTFLEHAKTNAAGERVTRFNALFHWAVPPGQELAAGREVGRHLIMTHCYWREGGPEFRNVNIMGVIHGTDRAMVLAHKAAIDAHLQEAEIPLLYTNVFWGGRSEIKPSEIAPAAYQAWCEQEGLLYLLNPL
jgi:AsnC-like ligand binding domain